MSLSMLHLPVDMRGLMRAGREHGLVTAGWSVEPGYLIHSLLARLFGEQAPKPFDLQEPGRRCEREEEPAAGIDDRPVPLLAYSRATLDHLRAQAEGSPDRSAAAAILWESANAKPMPRFASGDELAFRVRLCPVVRVGRQHPRFAPGAEVDPYLAMVQRELALAQRERRGLGTDAGERTLKAELAARQPTREDVYREWLRQRLAPAAEIDGMRITAMRDARLWRKGAPGPGAARTMHGHARPESRGRTAIGRRDITVEGHLRVADPAAFAALLGRGVGRHRAFGFGMLLLRPPRSAPGRC